MGWRDRGRLVDVTRQPVEAYLDGDHPAGRATLTVDDAGVFNERGGLLSIGGLVVGYLAADDDTGTVRLASPLPADASDEDPVGVWSRRFERVKTERVAVVRLDGDSSGHPVELSMTRMVAASLLDGVRGGDGEQVVIAWGKDGGKVIDVELLDDTIDLTGQITDPTTEPPAGPEVGARLIFGEAAPAGYNSSSVASWWPDGLDQVSGVQPPAVWADDDPATWTTSHRIREVEEDRAGWDFVVAPVTGYVEGTLPTSITLTYAAEATSTLDSDETLQLAILFSDAEDVYGGSSPWPYQVSIGVAVGGTVEGEITVDLGEMWDPLRSLIDAGTCFAHVAITVAGSDTESSTRTLKVMSLGVQSGSVTESRNLVQQQTLMANGATGTDGESAQITLDRTTGALPIYGFDCIVPDGVDPATVTGLRIEIDVESGAGGFRWNLFADGDGDYFGLSTPGGTPYEIDGPVSIVEDLTPGAPYLYVDPGGWSMAELGARLAATDYPRVYGSVVAQETTTPIVISALRVVVQTTVVEDGTPGDGAPASDWSGLTVSDPIDVAELKSIVIGDPAAKIDVGDETALEVVVDPEKGKVLRWTSPAGTVGPQPGEGIAAIGLLPAATAFSIRTAVYLEDGFDLSLGGKIPGGLGASRADTVRPPSGGRPDGQGSSVRWMWKRRADGQVYWVTYWYDPIQPSSSYGQDLWLPVSPETGRWIELEHAGVLNTAEDTSGSNYQADGRLISKVDGVTRLNRDNVVYRRRSDVQVRWHLLSWFRGGASAPWAGASTSYMRLAPITITLT